MKKCSENTQQIYRRKPMPKCNFNEVALQLYCNHTSAWVFSCKFAAWFQKPFLKRTFGWLLLKLWIVLLQALKKKSSDWGKRIDWFEKFIKKSVLRNFAEFTGKHLCQNLFFNKVAVHRSPKTCTWLHEQFRTFHPSLHESVTIFLLTIN